MKHAEAQEAVLARMTASRAELIVAHVANEPVRPTRVARRLPATMRAAPWFLRTPNAELIAIALVGIAIFGLRRTIQTAVSAGLNASTHRAVGNLLNALRE
ncbi:hypothetical protein AWB80_08199 [Caballeronia pedi]|uniref:Uncharacterized protein n=1 Tax=Caballeronia pedi TaxID=1777141 RepID=A0A158E4N1_9BURK|nr:hypothetical protein [Caballeronia pedi]SAL01764.1 hypothetical protein AWB80_08199 [Caballeronia pedi]